MPPAARGAGRGVAAALAALAALAAAPAAADAPAAAAQVVSVASAAQLAAALNSGAAHVLITEHLDLRSLPVTAEDSNGSIFDENDTLISLRVRASAHGLPQRCGSVFGENDTLASLRARPPRRFGMCLRVATM